MVMNSLKLLFIWMNGDSSALEEKKGGCFGVVLAYDLFWAQNIWESTNVGEIFSDLSLST